MPLPTIRKQANALTEEQITKLESDDDFLRGSSALEIVNDAIKKAGIEIPATYVFKKRDRGMIETASHAVFHLLGGVPGMMLWAKENKNQFYSAYMKMAPLEGGLSGSGQIVIQTAVPESPLTKTVIDIQGRVIEDSDDDAAF